MRIKYSPLIDKEVQLQSVGGVSLEGTVTLAGAINGKPAQLILTVQEAALIYRALKKHDIEAMERVYA